MVISQLHGEAEHINMYIYSFVAVNMLNYISEALRLISFLHWWIPNPMVFVV